MTNHPKSSTMQAEEVHSPKQGAQPANLPSLAYVVEKFLNSEWCGVLNGHQTKHIAKEVEFQWELAKLAVAQPVPDEQDSDQG